MFLTQKEMETIALATVGFDGKATEVEIQAALEWANGVRTDLALLQSVLEGRMLCKKQGDEMTFRLTDKENEAIRKKIRLPKPASAE